MSVPSANADAYAWIGPSGGSWGFAGNWQDLSSGANPATGSPGTLTPVTIAGQASLAISGGGLSASLWLTGNVGLDGAYTTGALSVGKRTIVGAGSISVSYVYAAGAVTVANSLSANTLNLANGSLGFAGTGATLAVSGAITIGAQSVVGAGLYDPGAGASIGLTAGTTMTGLGALAIAQGSVSVSGAGANVAVSGPVSLGAAGVQAAAGSASSFDSIGAIAVLGGGGFAVANALTEAVGSVAVDGAGSRLTVQTMLTLGLAASRGFGTYSLSVTNGGRLQAGGIAIQAPATRNPGPATTSIASLYVDATGAIDIGSGVAAAGTITIDAGKSLAVTTDAAITGAIVDNGVLSEAGGGLTLSGNVSGTGGLRIGRNGTVTMNGNVSASAAIVFTDSAASLIIGNNATTGAPYNIGATISSFQLGDSIVFGVAATGLAYSPITSTLGILTLLNGSNALAALSISGNYTPGNFVLSPTTSGGSFIGLLAPQINSGLGMASNSDAYAWVGSTGGNWGATSNWLDLTSAGSTGNFSPGALTAVTVSGPAATAYEVIRGGGSSASLALIGNVDLSGFYQAGALAVGARVTVGAGSSSVSYVYAPGALIVANLVTASAVTLASGSLGVGLPGLGILGLAGTGATLVVSGAVTIGAQSVTGPGSHDPGAAAGILLAPGATLNAAALTIAQGSVSVSGAGASAVVTGAVSLGAAGLPPAGAAAYSFDSIGAIAVMNAGVFSANALTETAGSINVNGAGSRLTVQTLLTLGPTATTDLGTGSLSVTKGGRVQAGGIAIPAPTSRNAGTASIASPSLFVDAISAIEIGAGTAAAGTITIDAGQLVAVATDATITGAIVDNGVLSEAAGTLTLIGPLSGTGALRIGGNGAVTVNGNVAAGDSIVFTDPTATLTIGTNATAGTPFNIAATITGWQIGNSISFGVAANDVAYVPTGANSGELTLFNGGAVLATLVLAGNYASGNFALSPTIAGSDIGLRTIARSVALSDFNGDGMSDLLWQNDDGSPAIWELNGTSYIGGAVLGNPGPSWHLKGAGDFNGNGKSDFLWQNDDGSVAIWELNGTSYIGGAVLGNPGASWHVKGSGDFNGDGKSDILWQNDDGSVAIWEMNGTSYIGGAVLGNPGPSWHVKGSGDFNGDGKSDILWQNDDGSVAIWELNGTNYIGGAVLGNPGTSWHVKGSGDFNGDGNSDILWQNDDGSVAIWELNGTSVIGSAVIGNPGASWHVKGSGDFNGDGKSDILWQNDDGSVAIWEMNGTSYIGGAVLGNPGTAWHSIGSDGMRFISGATGNATLAATSEDDVFVFTSFAAGAHAIAGFNPAHDLVEFALTKFANFAAVQAASSASVGGTLIALGGGDQLLIQGIAPGALSASDFKFV